MSKSLKKILNAVSNVLVVLVVILALLLVGARIVGLQVFTVLSGSMEPTYHVGALIYVKKTAPEDIQAGDVITFMLNETTTATHRVVAVVPDDEDPGILRYQTKPHFLYNALLIIRSTAMRSGDAETAAMVQNLSNILRYVLRDDQNFTTVRDEINNVLDYFEIVRAGYENAFELEVDVDPAMLNAVICKLTLQPLVENCVEHGFDNPSEGGRIRLTGRIVDGRVSLVVWDDGKPWPENFSVSDEECPSESIGMANVRRRMALTFGDACAFHIFTPEEGGAAVELTFPYRFSVDFEDKRREIYS